MSIQHFIDLSTLAHEDYKAIIDLAIKLKQDHQKGVLNEQLKNKTLAMIFDKYSTRTRVSFEAGMTQLSGHALFLSSRDTQLGRSESIKDSAKVISTMVNGVMLRISSHEDMQTFAKYSSVPVINALSDESHPCQLLADLLTFEERRGSIKGKTVAWIGDGNNMCQTYMQAAKLCDFQLNIATPNHHQPQQKFITKYQDNISLSNNPQQASTGADLVVTDVWASMGQEDKKNNKERDFLGFKVSQNLMNLAKPNALFMHCLPAYRDKEVDAKVIDGEQSVVFAEAENRLHVQKALLIYLLV